MKKKTITLLGGSGFLAKYCISELLKDGHKVTVVCRNPHLAGDLRMMGPLDQLDVCSGNILSKDSIELFIRDSDIVINFVGVLFESGRSQTFENCHTLGPKNIAELSKKYDVQRLIHFSSIGANVDSESKYQQSKFLGEEKLDRLNDHLWIGASMDGKPLNQLNSLNQKWILVMGSEAHGIEKPIKSKLNMLYSIPKIGKGESLNVGVAMGIFLSKLAL